MQIKQKQYGSKGSFYVEENNALLAEMTYSMAGKELMIIDHTEVSDELRGKNTGYQLVHAAVEFARTNHIRIMPLCPFAKSVFDKKKDEFGDVLRSN
jgi:predicted GNAT family acetyltransferase